VKIAFVTTNLRGGGAEKALLKLAAALAGRQHEVHVILLEHVIEHAADAAFRLHALSRPGQQVTKGYFGKFLAAWKLARLHRRLECDMPFDMTISTLPFADEVAAQARLPRLWHRIANTLSAEIAALRKSSPGKAGRRLARYRRLYDGRNLIAVSDGVAEDLRNGLGLARANIVRIYNLFDAEAIRQQAQAPEPDLPSQPYVLHIGRFARQKRHDLLFEAFRSLPEPYRLVLLVNPDAALDAMLDRCGIRERTIVAGFRTNPYPWIGKAALLVLCSDHEGLPNVLIEALICGTRVVSTDCPSGPREILEGELGRFLVPMNDPAALGRAMQQALAADLVISARHFSKFAADSVLQQCEALPQLWRPDGL
jgi:glycosyltransferase involved in cell wall biosynthesis